MNDWQINLVNPRVRVFVAPAPDGHVWTADSEAPGGMSWQEPPSGPGGGPHADEHATGGDDPISPASIGAAAEDHDHDDAYAPAAHSHSYDTLGAAAAAQSAAEATAAAALAAHIGGNPHSQYQPTSAKGAANGYAGLGADGLVPTAQLPAASDGWTYVRLASDFPTTAATPQASPLAFTPAGSKRYAVEAWLLLRTATATVGGRPGWAWPGGAGHDGAGNFRAPNTATAEALAFTAGPAAGNAASTGFPNNTTSWFSEGKAVLLTAASPTGTLAVTLQSETAGTSVSVRAGSFLRYREIP